MSTPEHHEQPDGMPAKPPPLSRTRLWVGNAVVAPVMLWVAQRWSLRAEREAPGVNWPSVLEPVPDPDALVSAVVNWGIALLVAAVALRWAWMVWAKPGTRGRQVALWTLLVLWVGVWLGGVVAAWRTQANQRDLQNPQQLVLKVIAVQQLDANARSEGGGRVFVEWPEQGGLFRTVLANPSPELLAKPASIELTVAPGRWSGWFVQSWAVPDTATAIPAKKESP